MNLFYPLSPTASFISLDDVAATIISGVQKRHNIALLKNHACVRELFFSDVVLVENTTIDHEKIMNKPCHTLRSEITQFFTVKK